MDSGFRTESGRPAFREIAVRTMPTTNKILLVSALLLACIGCNSTNPRILPDQVVGFWTTDAVGYRGRFLELTNAFVIVGAGENGSPRVQLIDEVVVEKNNTATTYTIYSTSLDGTQDRMTLQFDPRHGGEIRLKNQGGLWTRSSQ